MKTEMITRDSFGLPLDLGDGLVLRWATPDDVEAVAAFNAHVHSDNPEEPAAFLGHWTRDLMNGKHPTTRASDFTVVVDENEGGKIVSSLNLISQRWAYDGIVFGVGRPELVGTLAAYRRRGLVRQQMQVVHALSESRGEMVQAITGIPWYYRQFGYEMAVNLGGGRAFFWQRPGNVQDVNPEPYRMRPATAEDIPALMALYQVHSANSLLVRVRDEALWRYEMLEAHADTGYDRNVHMIETAAGELVAYVEFQQWGGSFQVRELGVQPGRSWRAVALFVTRALKKRADELNKEREKPIDHMAFGLGEAHPVYDALGRQLEQLRMPYAWYMRVPDLPAFLRHIAPVLEARLTVGVMSGYTGTLKLNFYREQLALEFEAGRLAGIGTYEPERLEDGDARFPDLTFLQVLFGYRSVVEVEYAFADCYMSEEARILLSELFPKRPSLIIPLG